MFSGFVCSICRYSLSVYVFQCLSVPSVCTVHLLICSIDLHVSSVCHSRLFCLFVCVCVCVFFFNPHYVGKRRYFICQLWTGRKLQHPYVKIESTHQQHRPHFLELSAWPHINVDTPAATCPFDGKGVTAVRRSGRGDRDGLASIGHFFTPGSHSTTHRR